PLDVQDFPAQGQDGLELAVATLLGAAAGGIALNDVDFAALRLPVGAVRQLAGQGAAFQGGFAAGQFAGLAGGFAGLHGGLRLADDQLGDLRVQLQPVLQLFAQHVLDNPLNFAVAELFLGLTFKLGVADLDADNGGQPFADVITA